MMNTYFLEQANDSMHLAKTIENTIKIGNPQSLLSTFRWILLSTTFATIIGAVLMPTFIKVFGKAVESFSINRSIPKLLLHGFSKSGILQFKSSVTRPTDFSCIMMPRCVWILI